MWMRTGLVFALQLMTRNLFICILKSDMIIKRKDYLGGKSKVVDEEHG